MSKNEKIQIPDNEENIKLIELALQQYKDGNYAASANNMALVVMKINLVLYGGDAS